MIQMDAKKEYEQVRDERGLLPHDDRSAYDIELLAFFIAGACRATTHALDSIKETAELGKVSKF